MTKPGAGPATWITRPALQRALRCSRTVVDAMLADGVPYTSEGDGRGSTLKINREAALAWAEDNGLERMHGLAELRVAVEQERLRMLRLKVAEAEGQVVDREQVRRLIVTHRKAERDAHMAWVMRTSPALATELGVDANRMFAALDAAMREHLHHLAVEPVGGVLTDH